MSQIMLLASMNSLLFSQMKHPMNMGILLLIQTLLMCLATGNMSQTLWFSYILFLVFLGGMLVLFIYMTSIASNEIFHKSNYSVTMVAIMVMTIIFIVSTFDYSIFSLNNTNEAMVLSEMFNNKDKEMLAKLYNNPNGLMTIFMLLYLFLTLIVVVFITKYNQGPLRPMN
uniref:NADH-ubiquinone oxidoreductase chain 6 n=1 Tax=Epiophlebia superstes TaxID=126247 RepID=V9IT43_9ODON|nr:NADH dehydrogenase subunit 6 [Epiophlebia superstes]AFM83561.1 NADH dehydrogenase subunit 6 [Epiophlebia superstes]